MALKQTKPDNQAVGGCSIYKSHEQVLSLQMQKNGFKDLKEFVLEEMARHDEIVNQNLEKFRQEIKELVQQKYDNLKRYIVTALKSFSEIIIKMDKDINLEIESKMKEAGYKIHNLDNKIQRIENDLINIQENSPEVESKIKEADHKTYNADNIKQRIENEVTMMQFRSMEFAVRMRGIQENNRDDLRKMSAEVLAGILKVSPEEVSCKIDKAYRINSWVAKQRQLPRDVVIYFTDKGIRNDIVQKSFNSTLEMNGRKIWIYKELPSKMLKDRKDFGFLVTELKKQNIPFRWDAPVGIILRYQGKRYQLNTVEKAEEFYYKVFKNTSPRMSSVLGTQEGDKEKQNEQEIETQAKQMEMEVMEKQQVTEAFLDEPLLDSPSEAIAGLPINIREAALDFDLMSYQVTDQHVTQSADIQVLERQSGWRSKPQQVKKRRSRLYKTKKF